MNKKVLDYVIEKTNELMSAVTCSAETKSAAKSWLEALGTDKEVAETQTYIKELEMDIMPIDNLIVFAESDAGAQVFGADKAKNVAEHARAIKAAGARHCDCPACTVVAEILEKKDELLN